MIFKSPSYSLFSLILLITAAPISLTNGAETKQKPTRNVEITADQEKLRDPEGFAAIRELHRLMDDDQSGSIDRFESADFLSEDLKIGGNDRARREKAFHHNNDDSITVDDLWEAWFQSEIRNWDEQETVEWLKHVVKLPQYSNNFLGNHVNGVMLPRMATQNSTYLINQLGIKNFVHRQKLQLKTLDLVLFGFQEISSPWKDVALAVSVVGLVSVLIILKVHNRRARREMDELSSRFSELKTMESDFEGVEEERQRKQSALEAKAKHIETLKTQLMEAERRIEMSGLDSITYTLQPLLRRTYELESSYINQQKLECLAEMREATEFVDRLRRKQGLMNSFKLATGSYSGTDDLDNKIFNLKARMEKIKLAMEECSSRWVEIESLCGFSIVGTFGHHHPLPATLGGSIAPSLPDDDSHLMMQHQSNPRMQTPQRGYDVPASSIPPSVQSVIYSEDFNNSSTVSSKSSMVNSIPPLHRHVPSAKQEELPVAAAFRNGTTASNANNGSPSANDDTASHSSSGKSGSKRSNKLGDFLKRKLTKPE